MSQYYTGVVRKKYVLHCVAPDQSSVEIHTCYDSSQAAAAKSAAVKVFELMAESFDMDENFEFKITESVEATEDIPLTEIKER